jgi:plasmid stabilization system protein ParE
MDERPHQVIWSKRADKQLYEAFKYIAKDSVVNAQKVVLDIQKAVEKVSRNPASRSLDKYKRNNDGNYRYFIKHHYRVSYRMASYNRIYIVRLRHTKQQTRFY